MQSAPPDREQVSEQSILSKDYSSWRLLYRVPWVVLHLFVGLPLTLLSFLPFIRIFRVRGRHLNEHMQLWWGAGVCRIFGVQRKVTGAFPPGPQLVAANHISWLDIEVLHSISPMGFVAKAEIESWPVAGWVAKFGETVFHHRGSHDSSSSASQALNQRLAQGRKVAVFAEGGILPGEGVKRFHARMFAAAIDSGVPVQPVMLRYLRDGKRYPDVTFLENEHFGANILRLMRQRPCVAEVHILPEIPSVGSQRKELAAQSEAAVVAAFQSDPLP